MNHKLTVIKIGGAVLEDDSALTEFLTSFAAWSELKILVHGGGKKATELAKKLNLKPKIIDGRRITDSSMLEVALMVYGGWYNKTIVARLQQLGINAIGLSGADARVILAQKRPAGTIDYGLVGDIVSVDVQRMHWFLESDLVPVFCALTHDGKGQVLNTNADTIATQLAVALSKVFNTELIFAFEKSGVLSMASDDNSVIAHLNLEKYQQYRSQNVITNGMIPKIDNAFYALKQGVQNVRITHYHHLKNGTLITMD